MASQRKITEIVEGYVRRREMEGAESGAGSDEPNEDESRREKAAAQLGRLGLTPCSYALFHLYIFLSVALLLFCLLLAATGTLVGLMSLQPFPFLHPISRFAYALVALASFVNLLFFSALLLFQNGGMAGYFAAMKRERPERLRHTAWKPAISTCTSVLLIAYLVILAIRPRALTERWPVWSLPPLVQGLVNTGIFLGITALFVLITWLPGRVLGRPNRRSSNEQPSTAS